MGGYGRRSNAAHWIILLATKNGEKPSGFSPILITVKNFLAANLAITDPTTPMLCLRRYAFCQNSY